MNQPQMLNASDMAQELMAYAYTRQFNLSQRILGPSLHEKGKYGALQVSIEDYAKTYQTADRVLLSESFVNDVLQPGRTGKFNPTENAFGFKSRWAWVNPAKVDLRIGEEERMQLWKSYLGMAVGLENFDMDTFPFEKYVLDSIVAKAQANLTPAVWNAVENRTGTTSLDITDGYKKLMAELVLDGSIPAGNFVVSGGLTIDNTVDKVEELVDLIPEEYRFRTDLVFLCSNAFVKKYRKALAKKFPGQAFNAKYDIDTVWDYDNLKFMVVPNGPELPIITVKGNLAYLYDNESWRSKLNIWYNPEVRAISYMMDFQIGCGIAVPELIWGLK